MSDWTMVVVGAVVVAALAWFAYANWREAKHARAVLESVWKAKAEAQRDAPSGLLLDAYARSASQQYIVTEKPKRKPRSDKGKRRRKKPGRKEVDIAGQRFGLLTAVRRDGAMYKSKQPAWIFRCDCGNVIRAAKSGIAFTTSEQVSCGCWKREVSAANAAKARAASAAKRKEMH